MEHLKKYRKASLDTFLKFVRDLPAIPPRKIFDKLEELGYRGQPIARRAVSLLAYRHVRRVQRIYLEEIPRELCLPKTNMLLCGPTGSGKTHLVELLFQHILRIPTALVDITTYSETGYVGQDASTIVTRLLHAADDNPLLASIGVLCLDEFDKIASGQNNAVFAGGGTTKDVTGLGVQRELLKMLEASEVVVPLDLTHASYSQSVTLSTADIAFIACGAFSGFHQVSKRRNQVGRVGFAREGKNVVDSEHLAAGFAQEDVDDVANFHAYGFLPELVGRFTRIVPFAALDTATLKTILEAQVLSRFRREFLDEGFELEIADDVLDHLVEQAQKQQTGARGLVATLSRSLEEAAFHAFASHPGGAVKLSLENAGLAVAVPGESPQPISAEPQTTVEEPPARGR